MPKKIIPFGICFFLLSPCIVLFFLSNNWVNPSWSEITWAMSNSLIQAFFSALLTIALGFVVALGHIRIAPERVLYKSVFEILCLMVQFIPVVISLVSVLNLIQPYPMGRIGIIFMHGYLNFGLAALLISHSMKAVWCETSDVSRTMGITRFQFWRRVGVPQIKKELSLIFLYFFSVFFTSFSVPLIVGGGKGTTLEILIFEKMRLSGDWTSAIMLAWIQIVFIFVLSLLAFKSHRKQNVRSVSIEWLGSKAGTVLLLLMMVGLFVGYGSGLADGWQQKQDLGLFASEITSGFFNSLVLGFLTYILIIGFLKALAYLGRVPKWLDIFLNGYLAPSTSLTCFGFLILLPTDAYWSYLKIPMAFTLLSLPALYRMGFGETLKQLQTQLEITSIMGASPYQVFLHVTWPQVKSRARFLAALCATWVCGDFAVARILASKDFTLGLIVQTLLSTYRMSLASLVSLFLLAACFLCFFMIMGWDYVDRRKSRN